MKYRVTKSGIHIKGNELEIGQIVDLSDQSALALVNKVEPLLIENLAESLENQDDDEEDDDQTETDSQDESEQVEWDKADYKAALDDLGIEYDGRASLETLIGLYQNAKA